MIPLLTSDEMRAADERTIRGGVPARVLMESAGRACADEVMAHCRPGDVVGIVCGTGNNGGDGLVVARLLHRAGWRAWLLVVGGEDELKADPRAMLESARVAGVPLRFAPDEAAVHAEAAALRDCTLVVDALFGTGLARAVTGRFSAAIAAVNAAPAVLAVDLPSGVHTDTGVSLGCSVHARWTVALAALKRAHALVPGADRCGEVSVVDIGIPVPPEVPCQGFGGVDARRWHKPRAMGAHKGSAGHVLVVGGSMGMTGAAVLAARGALRGGAGRVTALRLPGAEAPHAPEVTTVMLDPAALGAWVVQHRIPALVVGPGLAVDERGREWLTAALAAGTPCVLDAGALALLGTDLGALAGRGGLVLTPHPAELARLLGCSTESVMADRVGSACRAAETAGAVVIHKGARSVVALPGGRSRVCLGGHPVLATGGTGDVLAGMVGALLGRGLTAEDAASLGVFLHARAGELCAAALGPEGVLASEIADRVPAVFRELESA
ncbi:MAG: NAD(P)H-hydrate dehydratase [Deltaproteobacteria bacterium]|nr:NAD(P)H-hydrate dehydratase [Deltaproteobacteria bacterium]